MSRNSVKARRICFDTHKKVDENGHVYMICSCGCGMRFNPAITKWRADHGARHAEGGKETATNLWPIIEKHDAGPDGKAAKDAKEIAHGKRASERHFGVKQSRGFPKRPKDQSWGRGWR